MRHPTKVVDYGSSAGLIHWIDVAFASQAPGTEAWIILIAGEGRASCYGVVLDDRWVADGSGELTAFDCPVAARRFLGLLGVNRIRWRSDGIGPALRPGRGYRLYRLLGQKLHVGSDPPDQATG
jgi:hypothetical protein